MARRASSVRSDGGAFAAGVAAIGLGLAGARIGYVALHLPYFRRHPLEALWLWEGGLSWVGGAIGVLVAIFLLARLRRQNSLLLDDSLAVPALLVAFAAWAGCGIDRCVYGIPTEQPFAIAGPDLFGTVAPRWPPAAWSSGLQPTLVAGDEHEVFFSSHFADFRRQDGLLAQATQVFVAPQDDVEVRLVTLTNHGDQPRPLRLTSYGEVVLAPQSSDAHHPAFNKLFIECEPLPRGHGLLFRRRPRSGSEEGIYLVHAVVTGTGEITVVPPGLEADRGRFLGRGRTTRSPAAMESGSLPGIGTSLDPIFSIHQEVYLPPHGTWTARRRSGSPRDRKSTGSRSISSRKPDWRSRIGLGQAPNDPWFR